MITDKDIEELISLIQESPVPQEDRYTDPDLKYLMQELGWLEDDK